MFGCADRRDKMSTSRCTTCRPISPYSIEPGPMLHITGLLSV